jgi:two-component system response regulator AtoC
VLLEPRLIVESFDVRASVSSTSLHGTGQPRGAVDRTRVLVVDDEPLIRWSVAEALLDDGFDVVTAEDGRSAITALAAAARAFDVVLLDYRLPDVENWTLLTLIRQMAPASAIVLVTASHTAELAAEARLRGACCVLRKPFDLIDLVDCVRTLGESIRSRAAS